ncbi:MAG: MotA/TolQ/ExbB proton channel family protein [Bacteroidales bacterium]|jgi:biopolymer transport protein ExbB|nr:MotA/TolQ/ExbB proton channel family protein [Bacteroidales bacterium]MDD3160494.1 MotA/TolQ/ExbB proton channel family protein [Bacteroidales bacterium]
MSLLLSIQQGLAEGSQQLSDTMSAMPQLTGDASVAEMNYFSLALKGGFIMIPLALMGFVAIYIWIERMVAIREASKMDKSFMNRIRDYIHDGKIESAVNLCKSSNNPSARMIEKGISRIGRPMNDVLIAIENVGNLETTKLERGFALLATIAGGAPMLGFLGTVTGMVRAFYDMSNAGSNVDIALLSSGIYEALVTTVAGLIVGIAAYFAYNYLVLRVDQVVHNMESSTMDFMDMLNEPAE